MTQGKKQFTKSDIHTRNDENLKVLGSTLFLDSKDKQAQINSNIGNTFKMLINIMWIFYPVYLGCWNYTCITHTMISINTNCYIVTFCVTFWHSIATIFFYCIFTTETFQEYKDIHFPLKITKLNFSFIYKKLCEQWTATKIFFLRVFDKKNFF